MEQQSNYCAEQSGIPGFGGLTHSKQEPIVGALLLRVLIKRGS